jgi:hypothetical protein
MAQLKQSQQDESPLLQQVPQHVIESRIHMHPANGNGRALQRNTQRRVVMSLRAPSMHRACN